MLSWCAVLQAEAGQSLQTSPFFLKKKVSDHVVLVKSFENASNIGIQMFFSFSFPFSGGLTHYCDGDFVPSKVNLKARSSATVASISFLHGELPDEPALERSIPNIKGKSHSLLNTDESGLNCSLQAIFFRNVASSLCERSWEPR